MDLRKPIAALALSAAGLVGIAAFETFRPVAYDDGVGVQTIGYGTTKGVKKGDRITPERAMAVLYADASEYGRAIARCTTAEVTQGQYDALVSFTYNVGPTAYCRSLLAQKLNAGDCHGAAAEFPRWNKAGGRVLRGLVKRRAGERAMFEEGCP